MRLLKFQESVLNWQRCDRVLKLSRYFHTLRYLRPGQVFGRFWFRLYSPRPDPGPPPLLRSLAALPVVWSARPPRMTGPESFFFLHEEGNLSTGWDSPEKSKLWRYNLHYFDDLCCNDAAERQQWHRALINRWVGENPPGFGSGWEPYPLSVRIVNWIKWSLTGNSLEMVWIHSLAMQVRYLAKRLEYHLLGNHLLANAKALVFAGLFFDGQEGEEWLSKGLAILNRQVAEQILPDGGHFERSPMYHAIILEDLLDLLNLARVFPGNVSDSVKDEWEKTVQGMRCWLVAMTHPDGEISFFNDAAFGIASGRKALDAYVVRLGYPNLPKSESGVTLLADSGYIRVEHEHIVALLDVAPVGPDYLPGHAHADTLSFELSFFGQRFVVNSGTSCYGAGPERLRQRGTAAHNTVEIDGQDSSEVWGGFRVARRARPFGLQVDSEEEVTRISCAHDGYRRLSGKPIHWREWIFGKKSVTIKDEVRGCYSEAISRIHFHPDVNIFPDKSAATGKIVFSEGRTINWIAKGKRFEIVEKKWHPGFGLTIKNACLMIYLDDAGASIHFSW